MVCREGGCPGSWARSTGFGSVALFLIALLILPLGGTHPIQAQAADRPAAQEPVAPATAPAGKATAGIGFWDLPDHAITVMLKMPPRKEAERYARLRGYFTEFGCTGENLAELELIHDRGHSDLLCTLPGATSTRIVVTAWLPHHELFPGSDSDGWAEAALLPMLYRALKAQPRQATFVFAELSDSHGDMAFEKQLEAGAAAPLALVSLYGIGFGVPEFSNVAATELEPSVRANAETLQTEAWRMMTLLHIRQTHDSIGGLSSSGPTIRIFAVRVGPKDLPHIFFYSNPATMPGQLPNVTLPAFHEEYNYLAFYLADIDQKLKSPAQ